MSRSSTIPRPPSRSWLASAALACAATALACLPSTPAPFGALGLLLALGTVSVAGVALLALFPHALVALVPALLPSPMLLLTFAWELALLALAGLLALQGWRARAGWLHRLGGTELAALAFTGWALFSVLWIDDPRQYMIGARRLAVGFCALWVATRLPAIASRRAFDAGLIAGASALALAALARSLTTGLSSEQALLRRPEVTNLGWGTANYVAALLLLFAPSLLRLASRPGARERAWAAAAFGLVTLVQLVVASRAAAVLFLAATFAQLWRAAGRARLWVVLGFAATLAAVLATPLGQGLLSRLESVRELGSMTIRLWYFREAWSRVLENLPWGLGLWQGFAHADRLQGIDPHNYWLLIGGDLGLPGILLWLAVLVAIARRIGSLRRDEPGREQAHALLVTFVIANLNTLVEPTFQGAHYQVFFYWIVGGALAYAGAGQAPVSVRAWPPAEGPSDALARSGA
jgi:hypothetical protein